MFSKWEAGVACIWNSASAYLLFIQAMAFKHGWLKCENGLNNEHFFHSKISLAQTWAAWLLIGNLRYITAIWAIFTPTKVALYHLTKLKMKVYLRYNNTHLQSNSSSRCQHYPPRYTANKKKKITYIKIKSTLFSGLRFTTQKIFISISLRFSYLWVIQRPYQKHIFPYRTCKGLGVR